MMDITVTLAKDIFEIISFIATTIGMMALVLGYRTYKTAAKQLNFEIVNSCTIRFHTILKELKYDPKNRNNIEAYFGLCNEELFYFRHHYLPKEVIFEWLTGMKDAVPHFVNGKNVNTSSSCIQHIFKDENHQDIDITYPYQRLRYTYTFPDMQMYQELSENTEAFVKYNYMRLKKWNIYQIEHKN